MKKGYGVGLAGVVVVAMVFVLGSFAGSEESAPKLSPVQLDAVEGSDFMRLTLTESAVSRLDIQTTEVSVDADGALFVPSAALIITPDGSHYVYANPEPLVFVRSEITEVVEDAYLAFFADGPPVGTSVVTTGVPELYGAEFGIGK